jgi:hypothetical protein
MANRLIDCAASSTWRRLPHGHPEDTTTAIPYAGVATFNGTRGVPSCLASDAKLTPNGRRNPISPSHSMVPTHLIDRCTVRRANGAIRQCGRRHEGLCLTADVRYLQRGVVHYLQVAHWEVRNAGQVAIVPADIRYAERLSGTQGLDRKPRTRRCGLPPLGCLR